MVTVTDTEILSVPSLPCILIHGGAGTTPAPDPHPALDGARKAAAAGWAVLVNGGTSLQAVEAAVIALEDDGQFNAGRGSCLTSDGTVEMDASIMEGARLHAGAVAAIRGVRNPVRLARRVMEDSGHLLLAGEGAERYAREIGERFEEMQWFITAKQRARYEELHAEALASGKVDRRKLGTVGAVAVDRNGVVAAATSTGGTAYKRPGRVGDTPLIGCGTFADNGSGAVSCTGHGESIIRTTLARWTCDAIAQGRSPAEAAQAASTLLRERVDGDGGLIVVGPDGRAGWAMNTPLMARAIMRPELPEPLARV